MSPLARFHNSAVALFALALVASGASASVTKNFHDTRPLPAGTSFGLENINGSVTIEVWDRQEVDIDATLRASDAEALDSLEVEVLTKANRILVETHYGRGERWGHRQVDYVVKVPRGAELDGVESVNGDVDITGVEGSVSASTVNGDLTLAGVGGAIEAETVNGEMSIHVAGGSTLESIQAEAVNGRIDITLPRSMGVTVAAETVNGRLKGNLGLEVERPKYGPGSSMHGRVGSGEVRLEAETVNGSISINHE
jgi:hypothetical protein